MIVIIVVIMVIAVALAVVFFAPAAPSIQVVDINIYAPTNACGLNSNPIYFPGFNSSTGTSEEITFGMPNYNATSCTITNASTNTTGFTLSAIQVPLVIPGMGNASMNITITMPSSPFSGNLNLILR